MRRKMMYGVIAAVCCILLAGGCVFAYQKAQEIAFKNSEQQITAHVETAVQGVANAIAREDLVTLLRQQGLEDDEIRKALSEYIHMVVRYEPSESVVSQIHSMVKDGCDLYYLMQVYEFLIGTQEGTQILQEVYEAGKQQGFSGNYWVEDAYNAATGSVHGVLGQKEILEYFGHNLTAEDIRIANAVSRCGKMTIGQLLDARVQDQDWDSLLQSATALTEQQVEMYGGEDGEDRVYILQNSQMGQALSSSIASNSAVFDTLEAVKEQKAQEAVEALAQKLETPEDTLNRGVNRLEGSGLSREEIAEFLRWGMTVKELEKAKEIATKTGLEIEAVIQRYLAENVWISVAEEVQ